MPAPSDRELVEAAIAAGEARLYSVQQLPGWRGAVDGKRRGVRRL